MRISETFLPEFDYEMASTRKTLERVPDEKFDWKPHEKSMAMGELATHITNLLTWGARALETESVDIAPPGQPPLRAEPINTRDEILKTFDKNASAAREAIAGASDEQLLQTWTLLHGGREIFKLPRTAVLRSFLMNHLIHHRAQLSVYLRLNDIPVPSLYGPSADEGAM